MAHDLQFVALGEAEPSQIDTHVILPDKRGKTYSAKALREWAALHSQHKAYPAALSNATDPSVVISTMERMGAKYVGGDQIDNLFFEVDGHRLAINTEAIEYVGRADEIKEGYSHPDRNGKFTHGAEKPFERAWTNPVEHRANEAVRLAKYDAELAERKLRINEEYRRDFTFYASTTTGDLDFVIDHRGTHEVTITPAQYYAYEDNPDSLPPYKHEDVSADDWVNPEPPDSYQPQMTVAEVVEKPTPDKLSISKVALQTGWNSDQIRDFAREAGVPMTKKQRAIGVADFDRMLDSIYGDRISDKQATLISVGLLDVEDATHVLSNVGLPAGDPNKAIADALAEKQAGIAARNEADKSVAKVSPDSTPKVVNMAMFHVQPKDDAKYELIEPNEFRRHEQNTLQVVKPEQASDGTYKASALKEWSLRNSTTPMDARRMGLGFEPVEAALDAAGAKFQGYANREELLDGFALIYELPADHQVSVGNDYISYRGSLNAKYGVDRELVIDDYIESEDEAKAIKQWLLDGKSKDYHYGRGSISEVYDERMRDAERMAEAGQPIEGIDRNLERHIYLGTDNYRHVLTDERDAVLDEYDKQFKPDDYGETHVSLTAAPIARPVIKEYDQVTEDRLDTIHARANFRGTITAAERADLIQMLTDGSVQDAELLQELLAVPTAKGADQPFVDPAVGLSNETEGEVSAMPSDPTAEQTIKEIKANAEERHRPNDMLGRDEHRTNRVKVSGLADGLWAPGQGVSRSWLMNRLTFLGAFYDPRDGTVSEKEALNLIEKQSNKSAEQKAFAMSKVRRMTDERIARISPDSGGGMPDMASPVAPLNDLDNDGIADVVDPFISGDGGASSGRKVVDEIVDDEHGRRYTVEQDHNGKFSVVVETLVEGQGAGDSRVINSSPSYAARGAATRFINREREREERNSKPLEDGMPEILSPVAPLTDFDGDGIADVGEPPPPTPIRADVEILPPIGQAEPEPQASEQPEPKGDGWETVREEVDERRNVKYIHKASADGLSHIVITETLGELPDDKDSFANIGYSAETIDVSNLYTRAGATRYLNNQRGLGDPEEEDGEGRLVMDSATNNPDYDTQGGTYKRDVKQIVDEDNGYRHTVKQPYGFGAGYVVVTERLDGEHVTTSKEYKSLGAVTRYINKNSPKADSKAASDDEPKGVDDLFDIIAPVAEAGIEVAMERGGGISTMSDVSLSPVGGGLDGGNIVMAVVEEEIPGSSLAVDLAMDAVDSYEPTPAKSKKPKKKKGRSRSDIISAAANKATANKKKKAPRRHPFLSKAEARRS